MSRRIVNYRAGDRAEDLGVFLMKTFCAVAPVPRQEDFGLADAIATLLRREEGFWYAEDSFVVQFKSRTVEMSSFWDLSSTDGSNRISPSSSRKSICSPPAWTSTRWAAPFWDPRLNDATGIVGWLCRRNPEPVGLVDGVLHVRLDRPLLRWSSAQTEDANFIDRAYAVIKEWLRLERWNRRYFRAGVAREIRWETGELPTEGDEVHAWTPSRGRAAVEDIAPLVRLLGLHARHHPELRGPVQSIVHALAGGATAGFLKPFEMITDATSTLDLLRAALEARPEADIAAVVRLVEVRDGFANFWLYSAGRGGQAGVSRYSGTLDELRERGFSVAAEFTAGGGRLTFELLDSWFAKLPIRFELLPCLDEPDAMIQASGYSGLFYLRKVAAGGDRHNEHVNCPAGSAEDHVTGASIFRCARQPRRYRGD